jgi:asparagine synthase (glutamine-hydrolysing)
MCAIAGVIGPDNAADLARRMTEAQRHRGPDGGGLFTDPGAGLALGHRRLAILDLSDAGRQPMTSRDGRWTIVLNGEIFNYVELRRELGGAFRTATDTEVLLEACAAWGVEKAISRSVGMFAFALWDSKERELVLVRDRAGEKPLVYFWDGKTLAFASELKALEPLHERRLDAEALDCYLALGYVPAPLAIFRNCRKLPPGHLLRFRKGSLRVDRWWFPEQTGETPEGSRFERVSKLRALMADAVKLRLRSDVPIALYLSGGLDSSAIAAECVRLGAGPQAYTVAFDGDETDLPYARETAQKLGLRHQVLRVGRGTLAQDLESFRRQYDEPFADSSAVPSLALARALAGRYKVVLNGDGGDEALAGYRHYHYIGVKQAAKAAAAALGFCDGRAHGPLGVYVESKVTFRAGERIRLLNGNAGDDTLASVLASQSYLACGRNGGALGRALWTDRHLYLPNDLTYKMDIALSSFGIEGRAPFLDHRLLEWAQGLPARDLVRRGSGKILLRAAYAGDLPAAVLDRPKHGFGAPVDRWLRGPLLAAAAESVPCPLLERDRQKGLSGQKLWTLFALAAWAREWRATW